jgi:maleate isomerase
MPKLYRIGQLVPSSNTAMETEIPAMLLARQSIRPERLSFHSSRMRMKKVVKEELAAMDAASDRCAVELSDARVDVLGYACLVAIMAMGHGYHRASESRLQALAKENGTDASAIATTYSMLKALKLDAIVPGAGALLSGAY